MFGQPATDLVEPKADERLSAADVRWRREQIGRDRGRALDQAGDAPVEPRRATPSRYSWEAVLRPSVFSIGDYSNRAAMSLRSGPECLQQLARVVRDRLRLVGYSIYVNVNKKSIGARMITGIAEQADCILHARCADGCDRCAAGKAVLLFRSQENCA